MTSSCQVMLSTSKKFLARVDRSDHWRGAVSYLHCIPTQGRGKLEGEPRGCESSVATQPCQAVLGDLEINLR